MKETSSQLHQNVLAFLSDMMYNKDNQTKEVPTMENRFNYNDVPAKVSIRRMARELNLNYSLVLKASKKPIEGQMYDPTTPNVEAINEYVNARVAPEVIAEIDWNEVAEQITEVAALPKEFELNQRVTLRQDENIYTIIYMTETHVVIISDELLVPRVLSKNTFLHQGPRIVEA